MGVTRSAAWDWEKGRSQIPSADIPKLAAFLGVTICELYGVDEVHGVPQTLPRVIAERLAAALGTDPAKIEVNLYGQGSYERRTWIKPQSDVDVMVAAPEGLRFLRNYLAHAMTLPQEQREELDELIASYGQGEAR
jgi:transcriptional regulator with XRE-family HTH domain